MDFTAKVKKGSGRRALLTDENSDDNRGGFEKFWKLAKQCRQEYLDFVSSGYVPESVILFDWGMQMIELNDVVEKEAENAKTFGRAYTCGVSNMGVFSPSSTTASSSSSSSSSSTTYGPYRLSGIHYATSHSLTGSLYQVSCGTVDGALCLTHHYAWPIVERETAISFADSYLQLLKHIVRT